MFGRGGEVRESYSAVRSEASSGIGEQLSIGFGERNCVEEAEVHEHYVCGIWRRWMGQQFFWKDDKCNFN